MLRNGGRFLLNIEWMPAEAGRGCKNEKDQVFAVSGRCSNPVGVFTGVRSTKADNL